RTADMCASWRITISILHRYRHLNWWPARDLAPCPSPTRRGERVCCRPAEWSPGPSPCRGGWPIGRERSARQPETSPPAPLLRGEGSQSAAEATGDTGTDRTASMFTYLALLRPRRQRATMAANRPRLPISARGAAHDVFVVASGSIARSG